jgi:hypothetical protein
MVKIPENSRAFEIFLSKSRESEEIIEDKKTLNFPVEKERMVIF